MRFFPLKKKVKNNFFLFFASSLVLNFAIFKLSRNSQNKSHTNIKCFTVVCPVIILCLMLQVL